MVAGIGRNEVRGEHDAPHHAIVEVSNIKIAQAVSRYATWGVELGRGSFATVAAIAARTADSGDRRDGSSTGRSLADGAVGLLRNINVGRTGGVDRDPIGMIESGDGGSAHDSVTAVALSTTAGDHDERSVGL